MKIRKFQFGFTLVELLVAVGIVALLSAAAVTSYRSANVRSRDARRRADLEQIRAALEMYRTDIGTYPTTLTALSPTYLNNTVADPLTGTTTPYQYSSPSPYTTYILCANLEQNPAVDTCPSFGTAYDYGIRNP